MTAGTSFLDSDVAVSVEGVDKSYGGRRILRGFDLQIRNGEFVALLGASGSGKTTLLRALDDLEPINEGRIRVPTPCAVVFQEPRLFPSKRVSENVTVGQPDTASQRAAALAALQEVGLQSHANAWPSTLSGGEAQRVALARALVRKPRLLLLDEPFAALDALTRLKMQALVADLCARHKPATLLVTHDVDEAILLADRVLVLSAGKAELDVRIGLERPRVRSGLQFEALRRQFLSALGVDAPAESITY